MIPIAKQYSYMALQIYDIKHMKCEIEPNERARIYSSACPLTFVSVSTFGLLFLAAARHQINANALLASHPKLLCLDGALVRKR